MLKWSITIGEKPQGMWRPKITMRIWDDEPDNPLNIATRFDCFQVYSGGCSRRTCGICTSCPMRNAHNEVPDGFAKTDLKFYTSSSNRDGEVIKGCNCDSTSKIYEELTCIELPEHIFEFYPEWRPGVPDYTDYVEFLRDTYCLPVQEEYHARVAHAMTSAKTQVQVFTSDVMGAVQPGRKEGKNSPSRRLKIAG